MTDKIFQNALKGVPRVRVVDENGNVVCDNAYYWAIPRTIYCFKEDYEHHGYQIVEGVVTFDHGDCGLPNRPRFMNVTPPHRIELMPEEEK